MPDDVSGLVLTVGADISPVEQALNEIPAVAQQAGAAIDAALGSSLSGSATSLTNLSTAIGSVGTSAQSVVAPAQDLNARLQDLFAQGMSLKEALAAVGDAAGKAAPKLEELGASTRAAGEAASGAGTFFEQVAAAFVGFSAAELAIKVIEEIGHAIKEIAIASVESFAQMERFEVEMTRLTGSAQQASIALNNMRTLAASTPFSFEELAKGEQRMTAFGISTGQVTRVMHDAMDAAAATSNSFTLISNALERVEVTGTINARQLNQLGVSWEDLARTAGRSVQEIQKAVEKGGEGAAYDMDLLLRTVEAKFFGAAQALGTTLQGQFQILKNQITLMLGGIGEGLAPALKAVMTSVQDTLLPALQSVTDGLKALAPAFTLVGAAAQGFIGIASEYITAIGNIEKAVGYLGDRFLESAQTNIVLFKAGLHGLGVEESTLDNLGDSAQFLWDKFGSGTKIVNFTAEAFANFNATGAATALIAARNSAAFDDLSKHAGAHISALGDLRLGYRDASEALVKARALYDQIKDSTIEATDKTALLGKQQEVINKLWREADPAGYAAHVKELKQDLKDHIDTLAELTKKYGEHNVAVHAAAATLAQAQSAYDAAKVSGHGLAQAQDLLVAAETQYVKALEKSDPLMKSHAATLAEMGAQYAQAQMRVDATATALQQAQSAYEVAKTSGTALAQSTAVLVTAHENFSKALQGIDPLVKLHVSSLAAMGEAYDQNQFKVQAAKGVLDSAKVSLDAVTAAHGNVARALALVQQAQENYTAALKTADPLAKAHGATLAELSAKYDANKLAVEQATQTVKDANAANDGSAKAAELVRMAHVDLTAAMKAFNEGTKAATEKVKDHSESLDHLNTQAHANVMAMQSATQNLRMAEAANDGSAMAVARLTLAQRDYHAAVSAATGATQVHVQTIQDLTNHEIALQAAEAAAKLTLDAARAAYDGSSASLAVLNAAQAQFNKLVSEADPLLKRQISDLQGLAGAASGAASAVNSAGKALENFGVSGSSTAIAMQELMQMFGGYQSPLGLPSGVSSMGPGYSTAGMNETIVDGEIISSSQINPGSMSPSSHHGAAGTQSNAYSQISAAANAVSQLVSTTASAITASLATVSDAAAILQKIAQNDFVGAIKQLEADGVSMQDAFYQVMNAADAMRSAAASLQQATDAVVPELTPYINVVTGTPNFVPGVGSGGTAVITPTGLPASTIPGVGQAAAGVGSGTNVVISPVINAQGAVFGTGGVQSLATTVGNIVMDNFRRAGMRF